MSVESQKKSDGMAKVPCLVRGLDWRGLNPLDAYEQIRASFSGPSFILERTADEQPRSPDHSLIGFDVVEELSFGSGTLIIHKPGKKTRLRGNPFELVRDRLAAYQLASGSKLPDGMAAGIGYFSYDCASYLEKIPLPPTASGEALAQEAHLALYRTFVSFDLLKDQVTLIAYGFDGLSRKDLERRLDEVESILEGLSKPSARRPSNGATVRSGASLRAVSRTASMGKKRFHTAVSSVHRHIRDGDIFQCVLSEQFRLKLKSSPLAIYRELRAISSSPYLYFLDTGREEIVGASPETLVKLDRGVVTTFPIAGTRPRGKTKVEDKRREKQMLASPKEKAEHLMLVDLGRNDLGRVCEPGSVRVKHFMQVRRYSHVMHLVSTVEGDLKRGLSSWDALAACFPAGTLTGAPKIRAMQIISELEPVRRGIYGGTIVAFGLDGSMDSCIAIRTLVCRNGEAILQAGAGVVADSKAEREYDEIENKSRAMLTAVRAAEGRAR